MVKVHSMVGVSGSGKSTMAKSIAAENGLERVSSDEIRSDMIKQGALDKDAAFTPAGRDVVLAAMRARVVELVRAGKDVLIDSQNLNTKFRGMVFAELKGFDCYFIAHVMGTSREEVERRHAEREKVSPLYGFRVPQTKTMEERFKMFQPPTKAEGFDEIRIITEEEQAENWRRRQLND